jgi:outer membrane lipoprotein-sorting protein
MVSLKRQTRPTAPARVEQSRSWAATALFLVVASAFAAGCAATNKPSARAAGPPLQLETATKQQLLASYNDQASAIRSLNASISMKLTAGTAYSGVIKQYHEVNGFLLAQKPASIRVIGQAPIVGTNIFDMASDGETFHIYIPSKNKFLEGPASLRRESAHPIENLRPQHLVEAMFWTPIPPDAPVLFEAGDESEAPYYILTVVKNRSAANDSSPNAADWQIGEKVWFDRADLSIARLQVYDSGGNVTADIRYRQWSNFGAVRFARQIELTRPVEDYGLQIGISKLTANEQIPEDKFELKQPPGTELIHVGEEMNGPKPGEPQL